MVSFTAILFNMLVPLATLAAVVWIGFEVRALRRHGAGQRETQVSGDPDTDR